MQGRRRHTKSGPGIDNGGRVGGAAPGRVRDGGSPPAQLGDMGGALLAPPAGSGAEPLKPTLFALLNPPKTTQKVQ